MLEPQRHPVPARPRRTTALFVVVLLVVVAAAVAVAAVVAGLSAVSGTGASASGSDRSGLQSGQRGQSGQGDQDDSADGATGRAGGEVPSGASVFDDDLPAVSRLQPDLLEAVRTAARDAEHEGVRFVVNSGWRSPALQEALLDGAVAQYGSREEAARWVSTPATSCT